MKRAEMTVSTLMKIIILVFLLFLLAFFIGGDSFSGQFSRIKNFLPNYNSSESVKPGIELIRYDLAQNNIQWYDGDSWFAFGNGEAVLGKKRVSEPTAKNEFIKYYYETPRQKLPLEIKKDSAHRFPDNAYFNYVSDSATIETFGLGGRGAVVSRFEYIDYKSSTGVTVPGYLKIDLTGKVYSKEEKEQKSSWKIGEISNFGTDPKINIWADSQVESSVAYAQSVLGAAREINGLQFPCGVKPIADALASGEGLHSINCFSKNIILKNGFEFIKQGEISSEVAAESVNYRLAKYDTNKKSYQYFDVYLKVRVVSQRVGALTNKKIESEITTENLLGGEYTEFSPKLTEREIVQQVNAWRDSIFDKPISIHYTEDNLPKCAQFKVEKRAGNYLVVYLTNPIGQC